MAMDPKRKTMMKLVGVGVMMGGTTSGSGTGTVGSTTVTGTSATSGAGDGVAIRAMRTMTAAERAPAKPACKVRQRCWRRTTVSNVAAGVNSATPALME